MRNKMLAAVAAVMLVGTLIAASPATAKAVHPSRDTNWPCHGC